jgi:hypothetical protein
MSKIVKLVIDVVSRLDCRPPTHCYLRRKKGTALACSNHDCRSAVEVSNIANMLVNGQCLGVLRVSCITLVLLAARVPSGQAW